MIEFNRNVTVIYLTKRKTNVSYCTITIQDSLVLSSLHTQSCNSTLKSIQMHCLLSVVLQGPYKMSWSVVKHVVSFILYPQSGICSDFFFRAFRPLPPIPNSQFPSFFFRPLRMYFYGSCSYCWQSETILHRDPYDVCYLLIYPSTTSLILAHCCWCSSQSVSQSGSQSVSHSVGVWLHFNSKSCESCDIQWLHHSSSWILYHWISSSKQEYPFLSLSFFVPESFFSLLDFFICFFLRILLLILSWSLQPYISSHLNVWVDLIQFGFFLLFCVYLNVLARPLTLFLSFLVLGLL